MKELLNLPEFGVRIRRGITDGKLLYELEWDDRVAPVVHSAHYVTWEEALGDLVKFILNPDNIYAMEDQPEEIQEVYELLGCPCGVTPDKYSRAAGILLYYVLDDIIRGRLEE